MFGLLSTTRQYLFAASGSKTLQALLQYILGIVTSHVLISLVLLCALYSIAEHTFTASYFAAEYNFWLSAPTNVDWYSFWKPGFPSSWRILFLSLFVVPTFSFLQVLWLCLRHLGPARPHWWRRYVSPSRPSQGYSILPRGESDQREPSGIRDDEDYDSQDIELDAGSSRPHSPFNLKHQAPRHPFLFVLSLRFNFWFTMFCTSLWLGLQYRQPADLQYLPLIEKANANPRREGYANQEKIFIAAMFHNNENVIPYWSDSIIKTIHYLGADNVFVSIVESGSDDQSPALLQQLDDRLDTMQVQRRILTNDKAITKPVNGPEIGRIRFLSALRNRVLEPLVENGGYDKVIFSNDIFVEPETIIELLQTSGGEYDMACGMDYGQWGLYDMWVVRDRRARLASVLWPHFFDIQGYEAMQTESPVPVFSCWNGIVVFKADPVLPIHLRSNRTLSNAPLPFALPASHPVAHDSSLQGPTPALTPPARFRASAPGECLSSESFLLPYDFRRVFNMQRIFSNPRVIVAYEWRFYVYFKWFMRHPVLKWWIQKVYNGAWMREGVLVVGDPRGVWEWDGGDCHPF